MSTQQLEAFEKQCVAGLSYRAGLAAALLDAWAELPDTSVQSERSLIDLAQLGITEERAAREVLEKGVELGLLEATSSGFRSRGSAHSKFRRLAFALNAIEHYVSSVHKDATTARVVLTKPPTPSMLEQKLSELGWRTSELEPTEHAFHSMVRTAESRVVVMTPFLDVTGALWLRELFSLAQPGVDRVLVLRSLEDSARKDYPAGYDAIASWLMAASVRVFNYSIPRLEGGGRETFHAKVVLCDRNAAYLGSSNMNAASLEHSMEMGVALRGRAAADVAVVLDAVVSAAARWP
ncbi:MAG: phospholipase D-like domain-containing protein [Burkholderiales bacterium]|jgi:phosphatidylserine/phosphatidylglycerophosphate/cardiolipin synthase-like enzyme